MPRLKSDLHEDYARARAKGLLCKAAYARAGYEGRGGGYAYKINGRPDVKARVAELIDLARLCDEARPETMIVKLMGLAQTAANLGTASGLNAAKGLLAEAAKLRQQLEAQLLEPEANDLMRPEMSEEEWFRTYAPGKLDPRRNRGREPGSSTTRFSKSATAARGVIAALEEMAIDMAPRA